MSPPQKPSARDPIKQAAFTALKRVVDPLMDLMFDAGITVREFNLLMRNCAVRIAASRITNESGRISKSRVAIITGLARSEVARILNAPALASGTPHNQHPARKVLAAWYDNRRFLAPNGDPAVLPIFGKKRSFERLVALYSGGIPVRAMLDQLAQNDAVEVLPGRRIKAKSRVPIFRGMTPSAIAVIGERAGDLLNTLRRNLKATDNPLFESTAISSNVNIDAISLMRREISNQGAAFIDGANSLFSRSRLKSRISNLNRTEKCRVGVTVYYFQDELNTKNVDAPATFGRRKNLQRSAKRPKPATRGRPSDHASHRGGYE